MPARKRESRETQALFEKLFQQFAPAHNSKRLITEGEKFSNASGHIHDQIEKFHNEISKITLLSIILVWMRSAASDPLFGERSLKMMEELIDSGLLELQKNKKPCLLEDLESAFHSSLIDKLRSNENWSIQKREDFVLFYLEFSKWLSESTQGFISPAADLDRKMAARRKVPYDLFIKLISELDDRERILAKLFYLGGERSLDEILSLKIEDIDFSRRRIKFQNAPISYPEHVFDDLKQYLGKMKKGYVFSGRGGEKLNHTVPYRALKTVATKLKLDPSFSFKDLVKEH